MTKKSLTVLWLVALALGAAVALVKIGQDRAFETATERSRGDTLFESLPADKVAKVSIKSADASITVENGESGWAVAERDNYPANVGRINELLRTLIEVEVAQGIEAGPSYDGRFGMDATAKTEEDHGMQVVLFDSAGAELASVALGKNTEAAGGGGGGGPFGMGGGATGRFVRNRGEADAIYVTSETFPRVTAVAKDWLREDFVKVEKVKSIAMAAPKQKDIKGWKLTREDENADFTLEGAAEGEALDSTVTNPLKSIFSFARFEDVAASDQAKLLDESAEARTVTIETVEGFKYTIRFAPSVTENKEGDPAVAASNPNYLMTVEVAANIPSERKKEDGETEEDAKTKDEAFATRSKELTEKLETEQQLKGRVFEVTRWTVDALLKKREELIKKDAPATPPGAPGAGTPPMMPGGLPIQPGQPRPRRRIEAVTPPIAVPPLPEGVTPPEGAKPAEGKKMPEGATPAEGPKKPEGVEKPDAAKKPKGAAKKKAGNKKAKPANKPAKPAKPEGAEVGTEAGERAVDQPKKPEIRKEAAPEGPAAPGE